MMFLMRKGENPPKVGKTMEVYMRMKRRGRFITKIATRAECRLRRDKTRQDRISISISISSSTSAHQHISTSAHQHISTSAHQHISSISTSAHQQQHQQHISSSRNNNTIAAAAGGRRKEEGGRRRNEEEEEEEGGLDISPHAATPKTIHVHVPRNVNWKIN
eukprot:GHVU01026624.1.p1 GENE.GHVU01026624.1~~GHVU01026624.1.p1  ORF type:complete len:162 (+),score=51.36 GHVU01026624.1:297-782(+)